MIDTHLHLWNPAQFRYPWLDGIPSLNREFALAEYRGAADGEISASIFVECAASPDSCFDEARWALDFASDPANRIAGVVASVWPEREDFPGLLLALSRHPKLKGLRRVLHTESDELSQSSLFRKNVALLAEHQLTFDLCVLERQLPMAIDLVDACPATQFVLDHCGVPDISSDSPDFWRAQISELARRPNVACKVSGLLLYAGETQRTAEGIFPWFSHVLEAFGWDRLVWGGDWPVCTLAVTLEQWIAVTHSLLDMASATPAQRSGFLDGNATTIYHL
jgi:predicted TIM-barrel fold metal-dependent hydrolase